MKLAIVTDAWLPQVNGVITVFENIIGFLNRDGFEVSVIHPGLFTTLPLLFYPEIRLSLLPRRKIENLFAQEKPDYIHIATEGPLGLAARLVCTKKKLAFTTSYHTHFSHYTNVRLGYFFKTVYAYLKWFHNAGAYTFVATQSLKTELEARGFRNVVLWPLGIDTELFKRKENVPRSDFPKPVFVYFGRIAVEKNVEEFLTCNLPGTKLVIGDGPLRNNLEKTYGASSVFTGYKKREELVDWLSICDVFVFPSRTETFGLVVLEALAMDMPVAAHNVMGPKDIITDGVDGYLDENLEQAAIKCLQLSRKKCREKALLYSWDKSAKAFIQNLVRASTSSA